MNWKIKARIVTLVSSLPQPISYEIYYKIQRCFGSLKKPFNPIIHIKEGVNILKLLYKSGFSVVDKVFFEVGTGRVPIFPLVYWLAGAKNIVTMDINPYLKKEITKESLYYIYNNKEIILETFESFLVKERYNQLLDFCKTNFSLEKLLELANINYIAHGDASNTKICDESIDFHTSRGVYEHVPYEKIKAILTEGNRIVKQEGVFINNINYRDMFSQSSYSYYDKNITAINFLKYTDKEWNKYAGNNYMYVNRLRHDDFIELFKFLGHDIINMEIKKDERVLKLLSKGEFPLDDKFLIKDKEILSIVEAWLVTKKQL